MRSILEPSELLRRIEIYVEEEIRADRLPKGTFPLLREGLLAGEFERGNADTITAYGERMARSVVSKLVEREIASARVQILLRPHFGFQIEMLVTFVAIVWFSTKNLKFHCVYKTSPWAAINVQGPASRTALLPSDGNRG